jgi:hypothetical protein
MTPYMKGMIFFVSLPFVLSCALSAPYVIHVRSSFAPLVQTLFPEDPSLRIRVLSGSMVTVSAQQGHNQAHLIIGFEGHKQHLLRRGHYRPYARGHLALMVRNKNQDPWQCLGQWIGQDPESSSTGAAFVRWAQGRGMTKTQIQTLFLRQTNSLSGSYLLFHQGLGQVLVAYTTTPQFSDASPQKKTFYSIPLQGAYEEWGIVLTARGQEEEKTSHILDRLYSEEGQKALKEKALLDPVSRNGGP